MIQFIRDDGKEIKQIHCPSKREELDGFNSPFEILGTESVTHFMDKDDQ